MEPTPDLLTVKAVADELGVSPFTVRRWIASGDLPARRYSARTTRVHRDDLAALLERSTV